MDNILELSTVDVVTIEGDITNMSFVRSDKHNEYRHQTQGKKESKLLLQWNDCRKGIQLITCSVWILHQIGLNEWVVLRETDKTEPQNVNAFHLLSNTHIYCPLEFAYLDPNCRALVTVHFGDESQ